MPVQLWTVCGKTLVPCSVCFLEKTFYKQIFNKLFGFPNFEDFTILLNCLLLNARFIIYRSEYEKLRPNLGKFIAQLKRPKVLNMLLSSDV